MEWDETRLYKLTNKDGQSGLPSNALLHKLTWGWGVTHKAAMSDFPPALCSGTVIHAYRSPYQAVLFDVDHAWYRYNNNALLWECEGRVVVEDQSKVGCIELTSWRTVDIPEFVWANKWSIRDEWHRRRDPKQNINYIHRLLGVEEYE